jgi:hypothetical protein
MAACQITNETIPLDLPITSSILTPTQSPSSPESIFSYAPGFQLWQVADKDSRLAELVVAENGKRKKNEEEAEESQALGATKGAIPKQRKIKISRSKRNATSLRKRGSKIAPLKLMETIEESNDEDSSPPPPPSTTRKESMLKKRAQLILTARRAKVREEEAVKSRAEEEERAAINTITDDLIRDVSSSDEFIDMPSSIDKLAQELELSQAMAWLPNHQELDCMLQMKEEEDANVIQGDVLGNTDDVRLTLSMLNGIPEGCAGVGPPPVQQPQNKEVDVHQQLHVVVQDEDIQLQYVPNQHPLLQVAAPPPAWHESEGEDDLSKSPHQLLRMYMADKRMCLAMRRRLHLHFTTRYGVQPNPLHLRPQDIHRHFPFRTLRCLFCGSRYHWPTFCPQATGMDRHQKLAKMAAAMSYHGEATFCRTCVCLGHRSRHCLAAALCEMCNTRAHGRLFHRDGSARFDRTNHCEQARTRQMVRLANFLEPPPDYGRM